MATDLYPPAIEQIREDALKFIEARERRGQKTPLRAIGDSIGYSVAAVSNFFHRKKGDHAEISARIQEYLVREQARERGSLMDIPFVLTRQAKAMLEAITFAHTFGKMAAVIGRTGLGKSATVEEALRRDHSRILVDGTPIMGTPGLLREICRALEEHTTGLQEALFLRIRNRLLDHDGKPVGRVIIFDDAHKVSFKVLDLLCSLWDQTKVGIVLLGNEKLKPYLSVENPDYGQLGSRVYGRTWTVPDFTDADLAQLLDVIVHPDDLDAVLKLIEQDPRIAANKRCVCNVLEVAGTLGKKDGGRILLKHFKSALKVAIAA